MVEKSETKEIVVRDEVPLPAIKNLFSIAKYLYESGMFPSVESLAGAIAIIECGREIGLPPAVALQTMCVVKGRLCIESKAMLALAKRKGVSWKIIKLDNDGCEMEFYRDGFEPMRVSFTREDAEKMHLLGKDNWQKDLQTMYVYRTAARGIRRFAPDVFLLYTIEEIESADIPEPVQMPKIASQPSEKKEPITVEIKEKEKKKPIVKVTKKPRGTKKKAVTLPIEEPKPEPKPDFDPKPDFRLRIKTICHFASAHHHTIHPEENILSAGQILQDATEDSWEDEKGKHHYKGAMNFGDGKGGISQKFLPVAYKKVTEYVAENFGQDIVDDAIAQARQIERGLVQKGE